MVVACLIVLLAKVLDKVDHLGLTHASTDSAIGFPQNPAREDDPKAIEEKEVEVAASIVSVFS